MTAKLGPAGTPPPEEMAHTGWCVVCGVWCAVCGVVHGVWCVVCGERCVACAVGFGPTRCGQLGANAENAVIGGERRHRMSCPDVPHRHTLLPGVRGHQRGGARVHVRHEAVEAVAVRRGGPCVALLSLEGGF